MARRKRLSPTAPEHVQDRIPPGLETKSMRAPIAAVAGEVATTAAMDEMSETLRQAREDGRMVLRLPLDQIELDHLVRDRLWFDDEDSAALMQSLRMRGQQTPIEVTALPGDRYGLISGWRRCRALARLTEEGAADGHVLALLRQPKDGPDAYLAMIEENEIRAGLSYYERARIICKTVDLGLFPARIPALQTLFATASRARRSKIGSFCVLVEALDAELRFPTHIGERLGLKMAKAIQGDARVAKRLRQDLKAGMTESPEQEQALIEASLRGRDPGAASLPAKPAPEPVAPGLTLQRSANGKRLTLAGKAVTPDLEQALTAWLQARLG